MFIRIYNKSFTLVDLKKLCKRKYITNYSKLKKEVLVDFFKKYYAGIYIVNFIFKKKKKCNYMNFKDPITLEYISYPYVYLEIQDKQIVRYNIYDVYHYIKSTGIFKDPYTGLYFSDENILSFDNQLSFYGINKIKIYDLKYSEKYINQYKNQNEKNLQILGLDRQIGELITEIQNCAECICYSNERESLLYYYELTNNLLPTFSILFRQLVELDNVYAENSGKDYLSTFKNSIALKDILNIIIKYINTETSMI